MDGRSGETALGEASNPPATTSLVFGILAFVIQLWAWGDWVLRLRQSEAAMKRLLAGFGHSVESPGLAGVSALSLLSMAAGISAIVFGVKGRRLAKAGAPDRVTATIGVVLGIVFVAIPILALLAFIAWINCCAGPDF